MDDATTIPLPAGLKRFQTFGEIGPAYEIMGMGTAPGTVRIIVLESGEELDYSIDRALEDLEPDSKRR